MADSSLHWSGDKMANIPLTFYKCIPLKEICCILIKISPKPVPNGLIHNKQLLIGNGLAPRKPLPELNEGWPSWLTYMYLLSSFLYVLSHHTEVTFLGKIRFRKKTTHPCLQGNGIVHTNKSKLTHTLVLHLRLNHNCNLVRIMQLNAH